MQILVVEDEALIAAFIEKGLRAEGHAVSVEARGDRVLDRVVLERPDVVLLDVMLPGMDGFAVLGAIRAIDPGLPVIMVTARGDVTDRVRGLDSGATDYLAKPFAFAELAARVRAHLRTAAGREARADALQVGRIRLDLLTRHATMEGDEVRLSTREFALLGYLLRHPGQVLSRQQILDAVWGFTHEPRSNVVDVYVGYLRAKLDENGGASVIETVRGMGYRLLGMIGRVSIRTRLAAVSALLAVGLMIATMAAVFLIEGRSTEDRLYTETRAAVTALQSAVDRAGDDGPGPYLRARAGADELLYVDSVAGVATNRPDAAALAGRGTGRTEIKGRGYEVARIDRGDLLVVAAVPTDAADDEMASLKSTLLKIGIAGLILTLELAWFAAYRALRPLQRMADRAAEVTAGEPGARVGEPASRRDEIGRLGAAIDEMLDRLEASYSAQRRFVHDASHELRTPLTIARGHLEVLVMDPDPPISETRAVVELVVAEIDRVSRLVTSLLSLARLEDGAAAVREPVAIEALLQGAAGRGLGLGSRDFTVTVTPPELVYEADREALDSVLVNLVSNSVRHTDLGGRIVLAARQLDSEVELVVSDDGSGIPPELLPVLFDRFTRADPARARETGGNGLGLAICRAVVESHGGTIEAFSPPGGGATFVIHLPVNGVVRRLPEKALTDLS